MVAIVDIGGKQYRAEVGQEIVVDRVAGEEGDVVELKSVCVMGDDGDVRLDGELPVVSARVVEHLRGPKISISGSKPKRGFLVARGSAAPRASTWRRSPRRGQEPWLTRKVAAVPGTAAIPTLSVWASSVCR